MCDLFNLFAVGCRTLDEKLPEGFFDDKKQDAKVGVRGMLAGIFATPTVAADEIWNNLFLGCSPSFWCDVTVSKLFNHFCMPTALQSQKVTAALCTYPTSKLLFCTSSTATVILVYLRVCYVWRKCACSFLFRVAFISGCTVKVAGRYCTIICVLHALEVHLFVVQGWST